MKTERNKTLVTTTIDGVDRQVPQYILDLIEKDELDRIDEANADRREDLFQHLKKIIGESLEEHDNQALTISGWEIRIEFGMKQGKAAIMGFDKTKKRSKKD